MSLLEDRLERYNVLPTTFDILRRASKEIQDGSAKRAQNFYQSIQNKPDPGQTAIPDDKLLDLTSTLQRHWLKLFDGKIDDDFVHQSIAIGERHEEFGITPKLYIAAYNAVTDALIETIIVKFRWRAGEAAKIVTSLTSVMLLDIELTLTAYCDASAQKRHTTPENSFADQQHDRTMDLSVAINESAISNARMMNVIEDVDQQAQSISAAVDQMVSGISHIAEILAGLTDPAKVDMGASETCRFGKWYDSKAAEAASQKWKPQPSTFSPHLNNWPQKPVRCTRPKLNGVAPSF
ncbi:MAG: protoglobin domain-containing protein [Thalassospira sp.]|uniref:protoglobin domain-containing protein n=1 Tax=Thalassospira sp. TaxID=1912094 RepID=UPI0032EBAF3A